MGRPRGLEAIGHTSSRLTCPATAASVLSSSPFFGSRVRFPAAQSKFYNRATATWVRQWVQQTGMQQRVLQRVTTTGRQRGSGNRVPAREVRQGGRQEYFKTCTNAHDRELSTMMSLPPPPPPPPRSCAFWESSTARPELWIVLPIPSCHRHPGEARGRQLAGRALTWQSTMI